MESIFSCSCSCYDGDYDLPEFCRTEMPRARKEHFCCECDRTIRVGEKYERVSGKWDGALAEFKTCLGCSRLRDVCCRPPFMMLREHIIESFDYDYVDGTSACSWCSEWTDNDARLCNDCVSDAFGPNGQLVDDEEW